MTKVLIIDDEQMVTQTLETLIEMMLDYEVYTFNDPLALLESDFLDNTPIDLVLSDFMMPQKNGIEVLTAIKDKQPQAVPILLTGYADKENAIKSINEVGLYYYLEKPWDNQELVTVIKNGIEKKNLKDQVHNNMIIIEKRNDEITRLYDLLRKDFNNEMDNVVSVVVALANLIEAKDAYTDGHTRRVSDLCVALGKKAGMDVEAVKELQMAAIVHDIGKVGTPDQILNKPDKLTDIEFETMMSHPELGAKIIKPLTALEGCIDPVLHHHEKLDGTGYPDGLKGEEISLATRIVCIADIFDALFTDRPYKKRFSIDKSMEILDDMAGQGKLDADVVGYLHELVKTKEVFKYYPE